MRLTPLILALFLTGNTDAMARPSDAVPQSAPVQLLRIVSGPSGSESGGVFVLSEERSTFNRNTDREAIVYFQWQANPGPHKLVARWKGPDANFSSTSTIDYVAKDRRFGAYWRLTLSPSMPLGAWSIEVTVDGEPGGRYSFEIAETPVAGVPVKRVLTQAELYEKLSRLFVLIERSTWAGRQLDPGAGFVSSKGKLYTAMSIVDAADTLRATFADGTRRELTAVLAWNRSQDWAVIAGPEIEVPLSIAPSDNTKVGDRCVSMEGGSTGGRVLVDCTISGRRNPATAGLIATFLNGNGTPGAPVLNEFGELIGMVGASDVPGATRLPDVLRFRAQLKGAPIVPFDLVRVLPTAQPTLMAELRAKGELIEVITGDEHVLSGGFARGILKGNTVSPSDQRDEFSIREGKVTVFVTWNPQQRLKGATVLRLRDTENRTVVDSKPGKLDVRKGDMSLSSWQLPIVSVPGIYRADVLLDGKPIWRGFVRITP